MSWNFDNLFIIAMKNIYIHIHRSRKNVFYIVYVSLYYLIYYNFSQLGIYMQWITHLILSLSFFPYNIYLLLLYRTGYFIYVALYYRLFLTRMFPFFLFPPASFQLSLHGFLRSWYSILFLSHMYLTYLFLSIVNTIYFYTFYNTFNFNRM